MQMVKPNMTVQDMSAILNKLAPQFWGDDAIVESDLTNLVDFGEKYDNLTEGQRQSFQSGLIALVTEQVFVSSTFVGDNIDIIKSFHTAGGNGGIIQKSRIKPFDSVPDPSFDPAPGSTNDPYVNYGFELETVYYSNKSSEMFRYSIPDNWFTGMFLSLSSLSRVIAMIEGEIETAIRVHTELITKQTINAHAASVLDSNKKQQKVNLLALYNERFQPSTPLTVDKALTTPEFLRFSAWVVENKLGMISDYNTHSNLMNFRNSTPKSKTHLLLNDEFVNSMNRFLYADTFNASFAKLPNYRKVYKWLGAGQAEDDDTFESRTNINVKIKVPWKTTQVKVNQSYVLGMMYHPDAVGIYDFRKVTESKRDPIGLKTNYFTHISASTMVDPYEDFIVFYMENEPEAE